MTLSKEEAYRFIAEILKMDSGREKLATNRAKFLDELVKAFHSSVPFQNVTHVSQAVEAWHVPTWSEIKAAMMGGYGGLCYTLGGFMKALLAALGYDVHFASGSVFYPNNHVTVIVNNLTFEGSRHLVDIIGFPTFEAIPLDFEKESPEYSHSFLRYKFIKAGPNIIWRMHRQELEERPYVPEQEYIIDGWRRILVIDLTPKELFSFHETMVAVYTKPEVNATPFLRSYRAVWYPGLRLVAIKDRTLRIEGEGGKEERTQITTQEEMTTVMSAHFPVKLVPHVKAALDHLRVFPAVP